ncbi:MAG: hypothetical protein KDC85_13495 [Saprospiraceae bacterium]|nr:hypothetical protein [Saprospiraceae bacterium]MCB9325229.1 hypothetical protein [Lewinellaceae bacterium]
MINKRLKNVAWLLLLPCFVLAQEGSNLQLILEKATFRKGQRNFQIEVYLENKGLDTLFVIQPQSGHFEGNFLNHGDLGFVGEVKKPYQLALKQEGVCANEEVTYSSNEPTKLFHLYNFHVVTLYPGQRSKKFVASFAAEQTFCPEAQYTVQIAYDPQFTTITKEQKQQIELRKNAFDEIMGEAADFMEKEGIETEQRQPPRSLMHTIWDNDNIIQSLSRTKASSAAVAVVKA